MSAATIAARRRGVPARGGNFAFRAELISRILSRMASRYRNRNCLKKSLDSEYQTTPDVARRFSSLAHRLSLHERVSQIDVRKPPVVASMAALQSQAVRIHRQCRPSRPEI